MLIEANDINKILKIAASTDCTLGKRIFEHGMISIISFEYTDDLNYIVWTKIILKDEFAQIMIKKQDGKLGYVCSSDKKSINVPCKHIIATLFDMYINSEKYMQFYKENKGKIKLIDVDELGTKNNMLISKEANLQENQSSINISENSSISLTSKHSFFKYYENLELYDSSLGTNVKVYPKLELVHKDLEVCFKIGTEEKKYILKNLWEFTTNIRDNEYIKYGKELEFKHSLDNFSEESKPIVKFIYNQISNIMQYDGLSYNTIKLDKRYKQYIKLKYGNLDEFFNIYKDKVILFEKFSMFSSSSYGEYKIKLVEQDPKFNLDIVKNESEGLCINIDLTEVYILDGQENTYILNEDKLYKCSKEYKNAVITFLKSMKQAKTKQIILSKDESIFFCEFVLPQLKYHLDINISEDVLYEYKPDNLAVKLYLDVEHNLTMRVKFCYGEYSFNPFDNSEKVECNRNIIRENKVKKLFIKYKFMLDTKNKYLYLAKDEDIYNFFSEGINIYMDKFEVLVTDRLKQKKIIKNPNISIGVRLENDLLEFKFNNLDLTEKEINDIFKAYTLSKKYYRLKDGTFVDLFNSSIENTIKIAKALDIAPKELLNETIKVPKFRVIDIDNLLDDNKLIVEKSSEVKNLINNINNNENIEFKVPDSMQEVLRQYQKDGFCWLKNLEIYGFGGILADDMGLGKTIQVITLLLDEHLRNKGTSLVVCPSSLYINWKKEINKFAPHLKVLIIDGNANKRNELIRTSFKYDVVITSYDMLKRDVDSYIELNKTKIFKYVIADEAQYIKNANTQNSRALKKINGKVRFALTGTPMENSLSELWSIFDYIMPGYLYSYRKFKENFENYIVKDESIEITNKLQMLVAPFILRRTKKEVLKELPDKVETLLYSNMSKEQEKLYVTYYEKAKEQMKAELENGEFEQNRIKILSLITRLRQLCCHPSLFLENYTGECAKLTQCLEIIDDVIYSNHKILLFSQFTSMLDIIEQKLKQKGIKYLVLTGKTRVDTRVELVEEFNKNDEIKVFLISLKAGGTGLNLTGADVVIHYDPWWNLSVENQATDRAYRIGQQNNVQVFKLIAQNSIEEKIQALQEKKRSLSNLVVKNGEKYITKMQKEEIMELFEL